MMARGISGARFGVRFMPFLAAALLALCWQSLITQAHVHWDSGVCGLTLAGENCTTDTAAKHPGKPHVPASDCPICQAQALFGHYTAPSPAIFVPAVLAAAWLFAARMPDIAQPQFSHRWQSRAPPQSLRN